jgi:hypothetical protein
MTNPGKEGWSGVDLNGTGISMYPAPAQAMMTDIANILTAAQDGWKAANDRAKELEGKLGDGPLGRPFMEKYAPQAKQLREIIDDTIEQLDKLSTEGSKAPPLYLQADLEAGQNFGF